MRTRDPRRLVAASALLATASAVASLSAPVGTGAFTLTGDLLDLGQRDFRVLNNFSDPSANDNTTPHPDFPGVLGATQAIWKAHLEWSSVPFAGTGDQDPTQTVLGDGGANYDASFQGEITSAPGSNGNVHRELFDPNPGGVLAFTELPSSDGWTINYLSSVTWQDGPGDDGATDLQAVATHEIGHVLGLGHSSAGGATMAPFLTGGVSQRSLSADDVAGLQAVYGAAPASKPVITALGGTMLQASTLTIHGGGFAPFGNTVWFTSAAADGTPAMVSGVTSSAGGTRIDVTLPPDAADGSVLVLAGGATGASLSNEWPLDVVEHFTDLGPSGIGGLFGEPRLTGSGDTAPGGGPFTLVCQGGIPTQTSFVFLSTTVTPVPFYGGTFYPFPIAAQRVVPFNGAGVWSVTTAFGPAVPSGFEVALQCAHEDLAAPFGVSASNGLLVTVE